MQQECVSCSIAPVSITAPAPAPADIFALIVGGLRGAVAARMARHPLELPLLMLLYLRLGRAIARFTALAERVGAGRLPPPRPASPRTTPRRPHGRRLPRGFGWLCRNLPGEAACYGGQLRHLLAQPEMQILLAAAPQAGRILRPLCQMLAVPRPAILTPRARTALVATPHQPEPPAPARTSPPSVAQPGCPDAPDSDRAHTGRRARL